MTRNIMFLFLMLLLCFFFYDEQLPVLVQVKANHIIRQTTIRRRHSLASFTFCKHQNQKRKSNRIPLLRPKIDVSATSSNTNGRRQPIGRREEGRIFLSDEKTSSDSSIINDKSTSATTDKPQLKLFNSLTRQKDIFVPIKSNYVSMYTCGPTIYDYAHVGNFRAFLTYDLIKRVLLYFGYDVDHICNLTDVDDKIIKRCNEQNLSLIDLTSKYETYFMNDLEALNIIKARAYPRATDHIPEMVQLIKDLHENGLAYQSEEGSWYFNVAKKEGYGQQLVSLDVNNMKENASGIAGQQRISTTGEENNNISDEDEYDADKVGVRDFALWKAYKPNFDRNDAVWDTSIGRGRPGWHLECSAMAKKFLGDTIDIHCGGLDLKFPHHENEIAQSEGSFSPQDNNQRFCNCWLHSGFVNINDEKMSKSKGNFLSLRQACITNDDIRAYRYLVITSQYRQSLSYTKDATNASKRALKRIDKLMDQINTYMSSAASTSTTNVETSSTSLEKTIQSHLQNFEYAILDDINTPRAAAAMFGVVKAGENEIKRYRKEVDNNQEPSVQVELDLLGLQKVKDALLQMDQIFGIFYTVPSDDSSSSSSHTKSSDDNYNGDGDDIMKEITKLLEERTEAKKAKDFKLADSIRDRITELGFSVKDVKGGESTVIRN